MQSTIMNLKKLSLIDMRIIENIMIKKLKGYLHRKWFDKTYATKFSKVKNLNKQ